MLYVVVPTTHIHRHANTHTGKDEYTQAHAHITKDAPTQYSVFQILSKVAEGEENQ